ncbi:hypothetical protein J9B83_05635 [Marinomonas sp. A79]|uniref:KfrA N-terminal DNA-binding domain-containing protein n=1 Tax=Marinomonas vulgaris TaxID=2823372 RepID=A0ABS5HBJ8_9GAMM|nr:hypothetical protein [Marinomonas vulgaris]MBR7888419.1 hypothetical protein [Marinomonas vulgaris]
MARKANISKEEIHQACWELIETNRFPNIPRLTQHFLQKDGRRCSNTTFLNAITEWEESYANHQQNQLQELNTLLLPVFQRFSREATQHLGQLLDEKNAEIEMHHANKQDAANGSYDSLSSALVETQNQLDALNIQNNETQNALALTEQKLAVCQEQNSHIKQQYQDLLSQNKVVNAQLKQEQSQSAELQLNLSQKEVDLAKQDAKLSLLTSENRRLESLLDKLTKKHAIKIDEHWQLMTEKLDALTASLKSDQGKHRDEKQ